MKFIIDFFSSPIFGIIGGITTILIMLGLIYKIICRFFSITPIVFRLGIALWKRKIAIFSSLEKYESLKLILVDSNIFKERNILHIKKDNIEKAKDLSVFLVDWEDFWSEIETIFNARKNHQTPIVIYTKPWIIPPEQINIIANRPNTVVVNFKWRLLNDVLTSLITTSYDS